MTAGVVERGECRDVGVDELFVQQIGPEHDAFFDTWAREVLRRSSDARSNWGFARPALPVVRLKVPREEESRTTWLS